VLRSIPFLSLLARVCLAVILSASALAQSDYRIGPNDTLKIRVYDHEDMSGEARVSADGTIAFPLLGQVGVAGLSPSEAGQRLARMLDEQGFLKDPQLSVTVAEFRSQEVSVLGFVNKPGSYALDKENTVAGLIAKAGGVAVEGDDRAIVTNVRDGRPGRTEVDLKRVLEQGGITEDVAVRGGDVIFVPRAPTFYIYGEVQRPGAYRLERQMTVAQAISLGGGVTSRGSDRRVKIQRKSGEEQSEIDVGLTDLLRKDDVVYVGERWF
jgi:polysaccharide export outer membrane protein